MAYPNDPIRDRDAATDHRGGGAKRTIVILLVVALVALAIAWFTGLLKVDTDGALKAPEVDVSGGAVPDVDVKTGELDVGTKTETVEVPTIDVQKAGEPDAKAGSE